MEDIIDNYYMDIDNLFLTLENVNITNYIPLMYTLDKLGLEQFEHLTKKHNFSHISELEANEVAARALNGKLGPKSKILFFEYVSGDCARSKPFLKHLADLTGFVALDNNELILKKAKKDIKKEFFRINMHQIALNDFLCTTTTENLNLPRKFKKHKIKVFYTSSAQVNLFKREHLVDYFRHISNLMKKGDLFVIGSDPLKDIQKTSDLYHSISYEKLVKHILHRLNSEYNGDLSGDNFEYACTVSREDECAYHHLKCNLDHEARINNRMYQVLQGKIITIINNRFNYDTIRENGLKVGLNVIDSWTSSDGLMMTIGLEKGI